MANYLDMDLVGKYVLIKAKYLKSEYRASYKRVFLVDGGFGAKPWTEGRALFGVFIFDNEQCRMEGYMVERLATEKEISQAKKGGNHANSN